MGIIKRVIDFILQERLIESGEHIIVGFSGGPDSVFLLRVLEEYKKKVDSTIKYSLVHINHLLRGEDSDRDEAFCKELASRKNIDILINRVDVESLSKLNKKSHEEVGREERYKTFNEAMKLFGGTKIALAHNRDDVVETFLFRMIRGSSLDGLEGINYNKNGIIRPIINEYKNEILEYLNINNVKYCIDNTNFESDYTRNSIRLELIPFIEKRYNPKFKDKIISLVDDIKESNKSSTIPVESILEGEKIVISKLKSFDEFIQKKLLNSYLNRLSLKIDRYKINSMIELLNKGGTKRVSLTGGYFLVKDYNYIFIEKIKEREVSKEQELDNLDEKNSDSMDNLITLKIPGEVKFNQWTIRATVDNQPEFGNEVFATSLEEGDILTVRSRIPGDRIVPLGMESSKKIKEILINEKIPVGERDTLPVISIDSEIVWVATAVKSEKFALKRGDKNTTVVNLKVRRQ